MKFLRPILSMASVAFLIFWSRLILPLRKEPIPYSGWGDGATGTARTLAVPVVMFWLATVFAFLFICFNPYTRVENGLTRLGRWLTNLVLVPIAPALLFYAMHGPPVRFLLLYGFVALAGLWIYVDAKSRSERLKRSHPT